MKVAVTGSHGLIGSELVRQLRGDGHQVTPLVRSKKPAPGEVAWDPRGGTLDAASLEGHDALVNLAGAGLGDHRWTEAYKTEILHSRVKGTELLAKTLGQLSQPPAVMVSGSAVGFYGDRADEVLTEESTAGEGFLADVVARWERATAAALEAGVRVVTIRSGIVLSAHGGALKQLLFPFRLGLGGTLGSGRQYFSWVSIDDEVGAIRFALDNRAMAGPVNATAPSPVTQAEFTRTLGRVLRRPTRAPVPNLALYALYGREMVAEMLLAGQRVLPKALERAGYQFRHPDLESALRAVLDRPRQAA